MEGPRLRTDLIDWREACQFVATHHRHHRPPRGHKLSLGVWDGDRLAGVAIIGRPSSRVLDGRGWWEVTRTCVDGTPNANSCLYGAARRQSIKAGIPALVTYTMAAETGASLRAAGWTIDARLRPRPGWNGPARQRASYGVDNVARIRWLAPPP